jgi:hypothetical protein
MEYPGAICHFVNRGDRREELERKDASGAMTQEIVSQLASLRHSRVFAFPP